MNSGNVNTREGTLRTYLDKNSKVYGVVVAVGGFFSDVLQPIAPFAEYLLYTFLVLLVILTLTYLASKRSRQSIVSFLSISLMATIVSGAVFGLQSISDNPNGMLSEYVPGIDQLQLTMGIIQKDIADIKKDTTEIKAATSEINNKLDDIGSSFVHIGKLGGLINNPDTAVEYLNNAKIYEDRGDRNNALKSYEDYFSLSTISYYDPYEKYMELLESTYSLNKGKRKLISVEKIKPNDPGLKLIVILYNDSEDLIQQLQSFVDVNKSYIPGYLALLSSLPDNGTASWLQEVDVIKSLRVNASLDLIKEQYISPSSELLEEINELFHEDLPNVTDFVQFDVDYYAGPKLIVSVADKQKGKSVTLKLNNGTVAKASIGEINSAVFRLRDSVCGDNSNVTIEKMTVRQRLQMIDGGDIDPLDCSEQKEEIHNIRPGQYVTDVFYTNIDNEIITVATGLQFNIPEYTASISANPMKGYKQILHIIPFEDREKISISLREEGEFISASSGRFASNYDKEFILAASDVWSKNKIGDNSFIWVKDEKNNSVHILVDCQVTAGC